eukprot:scaffold16161_cov72-Phaeocystis_antarctica.AAC.1
MSTPTSSTSTSCRNRPAARSERATYATPSEQLRAYHRILLHAAWSARRACAGAARLALRLCPFGPMLAKGRL